MKKDLSGQANIKEHFLSEKTPFRLWNLLKIVNRQWYSNASVLVWCDDQGQKHTIHQGDGGEQGDALMPALFCLALKPASEAIRARLPQGAWVVSYLDDIYIVCDPSDAHTIFCSTRETLQRICHINVNLGKLAVWSKDVQPIPRDFQSLGANVWKADLDDDNCGLKVVGTPFRTDAYVQKK